MSITKYFLGLGLLLAACSSRDEAFCECLKAGDEFNEASNAYLQSGEGKEEELIELKKRKDKACVDYTEMSGEEMLKRKEDCAEE